MPDIRLNIEFYCDTCGSGMCSFTQESPRSKPDRPSFVVEPCPSCMKQERAEGYNEGYAEAEKKFNVE